ncbi:MAG: transcriptional repressor [Bacteroidaceae bacterium]|nr:transcriptional repressor [Bacteroidaceae bacterium]
MNTLASTPTDTLAIERAATEKLRRCGINVTRQRVCIMQYLMTHHVHPNADDIYSALAPQHPSLSRTTVYNTVRMLAAHGAVTLLSIDDHNINIDENTLPHAHLHCTRCGHIVDIPLQGISTLQASHAFTIGKHLVQEVHQYYKGVCQQCLEEMQDAQTLQ